MSAREYVDKVIDGQIYDPVLTFQIKNGFTVVKILSNYLYDPTAHQIMLHLLNGLTPNFLNNIWTVNRTWEKWYL